MINDLKTHIISALDRTVKDVENKGGKSIIFPVADAKALVESYQEEEEKKISENKEIRDRYWYLQEAKRCCTHNDIENTSHWIDRALEEYNPYKVT